MIPLGPNNWKGGNKEVTLSTAATWFATGNNLEIRGDLATRALICYLDSGSEKPEEREFKVDLYQWIPAHRPALVKAALTILRAYHVAGRPRQAIKQFGRFETWSDLVRSALVWCGVDDPCKARVTVAATDPERQQFGALLTAWHAVFKDARVTAAQVIRAAQGGVKAGEETNDVPGGEALRDALMTVAGDHDRINARIFGRYLAKRRNRMMDGFRLEQPASAAGAAIWRVIPVMPTTTNAQEEGRKSGFSGFCGFSSSNAENCQNATKGEDSGRVYQDDTFIRVSDGNPPNPPNPPDQWQPEPPPAADDFEVW